MTTTLGAVPAAAIPAPAATPATGAAPVARAEQIAAGLAHLRAVDRALAALIEADPDHDHDAWRADLPETDLFGCLVAQVVGQQISLSAARSIMRRLTDLCGGRIPAPEQVSALEETTLRGIGVSWRKAATLRELAARFADGRLSQERLATLDDDEVVAELTDVHGIGPWTVHGALLIHLRRADVVATGDVMLQATVAKHYGLDHRPTEAELSEIARPWHPHGSLAVNLLFAAAERDAADAAAAREEARRAKAQRAVERAARRVAAR